MNEARALFEAPISHLQSILTTFLQIMMTQEYIDNK